MKSFGVIVGGSFLLAATYACSYDWETAPVTAVSEAGADADVMDALATPDALGECRGPADCFKVDEPACCYATLNGKTQSKCRAETQCLNQGGALLCQTSSDCPSAKPTCDLSLSPSGTCR